MAREKILIVDDDIGVCEVVKAALEQAAFEVLCAYNAGDALSMFRKHKPALVVLDIRLPDLDGFEVCREIRRNGNIPIIILSERSDVVDKVLGLELGADDYISKPFVAREFVARVKAVLRRVVTSRPVQDEQLVELPGFYVNRLAREVRINERHVELTPREFDLIWHFAKGKDRVYTRDELLKQVWGYEEFYGDERTVDQHVKRLRHKMKLMSSSWRITTIWGIGYKFESAPRVDSDTIVDSQTVASWM